MTEAEETPVENTEETAPAQEEGGLDIKRAIQNLLKSARVSGKMYRGLRESAKALDRNEAALCILAENNDEPAYVKLVTALCARRELPIIQVESSEDLGQWAGLCRIDKDGKPQKIVKCSCVIIAEPGTDYEAYAFINEYIKKQNESSE